MYIYFLLKKRLVVTFLNKNTSDLWWLSLIMGQIAIASSSAFPALWPPYWSFPPPCKEGLIVCLAWLSLLLVYKHCNFVRFGLPQGGCCGFVKRHLPIPSQCITEINFYSEEKNITWWCKHYIISCSFLTFLIITSSCTLFRVMTQHHVCAGHESLVGTGLLFGATVSMLEGFLPASAVKMVHLQISSHDQHGKF